MCYPTSECKCTVYRVSSGDDLLGISDDSNLVFSDDGEAFNFRHVNVRGKNALAVLRGNSTALVKEGSAVGYMCSSAEVCFNSFFEGYGTSVAWLNDGARAHLYEASTAYAFGSRANVTLEDFSTLVVSPNSSVTVQALSERCRILVHEGATVMGVDGNDPRLIRITNNYFVDDKEQL